MRYIFLYEQQLGLSKMNRICIKDEFGNDRCFLGEDIRLPQFQKDNLSLEDRLRLIHSFDLRPDDVIVAGYPRSGNNWLHQMIYMLLEGTLDPPPLFGPDSYVNLELPQTLVASSHLSNLALFSRTFSSRTCQRSSLKKRSRWCTSPGTSRMSSCLCIVLQKNLLDANIIHRGQSFFLLC
ncbi:uncharacterized protein LOC112566694 [Pomacea canaliculata]|uniref:uncharacterized protein LOC112566694 n=1 Tax=Pomacea canaliculata TaxID=400727 RepID=UPI000D7331B2|nr:uncharacterized protein LOC112566694 [Pomacea canaliculata]